MSVGLPLKIKETRTFKKISYEGSLFFLFSRRSLRNFKKNLVFFLNLSEEEGNGKEFEEGMQEISEF